MVSERVESCAYLLATVMYTGYFCLDKVTCGLLGQSWIGNACCVVISTLQEPWVLRMKKKDSEDLHTC